jgi:hypothetical protein
MKLREQVKLPRGRSYLHLYQEVADNLNAKGRLPFRSRTYNSGIVQSHIHGKIIDEQVAEELSKVLYKWLQDE